MPDLLLLLLFQCQAAPGLLDQAVPKPLPLPQHQLLCLPLLCRHPAAVQQQLTSLLLVHLRQHNVGTMGRHGGAGAGVVPVSSNRMRTDAANLLETLFRTCCSLFTCR